MKRILMYGATGRTGKRALEYALEKGYAVTALVRSPDKITLQSDRLTVIKGLPTTIADVRKAMQGCNFVLNMLSALSQKESMSFKKLTPPHTLETTIGNSITVMDELHLKRIVSLSSIGVGDSYPYAPWYMKAFIKISNFKIVFADHNRQEQLLMQSDLDWTLARPVGLNNGEPLGKLVVSYNKTPSPFKISRLQVARFIVDNLESTEFIHKAPILSEIV